MLSVVGNVDLWKAVMNKKYDYTDNIFLTLY